MHQIKNDGLYQRSTYNYIHCVKTHLVLDLFEKEYKKHFDYIVVICPTIRINETYHVRGWVKNDDSVWLIEPKENLYQWIEKLSQLLSRFETPFIIDDIIANKDLDKRRQPLFELSISGRHWHHYLWLLMQSYSGIPKDLRRQAKAIFFWYPKERTGFRTIHDENDLLTDDELVFGRDFLKKSKYACLYIQNEFPRRFKLLNHI